MRKAKVTLLEKTWLAGPVALWFSYQPVLRIGQDATSYYELSLAAVYLVVLALVGLPSVLRNCRVLWGNAAVRLVGAFVLVSAVSLAWTLAPLRGLLTTGIVGALFLVLLAALAERNRLRVLAPKMLRVLVAAATVTSGLALVQLVAGIWLPSSLTLLCSGCIAEQFGFARPNLFAVEPQFLGSMLIAPMLASTYLLMQKKRTWGLEFALFLMTTALIATLSRGAIYAVLAGIVVLCVVYRKRHVLSLRAVGVMLCGGMVALCLQGLSASLSSNVQTSFTRAVYASLSQLSLGVLPSPQSVVEQAGNKVKQPKFEGYVQESTDTRIGRTRIAYETWSAEPARAIFGVGIGGAGSAMHRAFPQELGAREIVQNEYLEILLERGLIGAGLFAAILVGFFRWTHQARWVWSIGAAYAVQWLFFSGYPNALHIYFVLIALFALEGMPPRPQPATASIPSRK